MAREREAGDFALVSVAARLAVSDGVVQQAAVALGGVAPVPYRATVVEEYLASRPVADVDAAHAGTLSIPDARPHDRQRLQGGNGQQPGKASGGKVAGLIYMEEQDVPDSLQGD